MSKTSSNPKKQKIIVLGGKQKNCSNLGRKVIIRKSGEYKNWTGVIRKELTGLINGITVEFSNREMMNLFSPSDYYFVD